MKRIIALLLALFLSGCAGTQTGLIAVDGKLDDTEKALVGLTVDAALAAKPSAVAPANSDDPSYFVGQMTRLLIF